MPRDPQAIRDALVVVRCQLGEEGAFDALVLRWHRPLSTFVRRLASDPDTARELVQETWLGILRGLPRLREPEAFAPWAFRIARHALATRLRRQYRRPEPEPVDPDDLAAEAADPNRGLDIELLGAALDALPLADREAVLLFHLQELKLEEVAAITGVPVGTVKSRLFRARRSLRHHLGTRSPGRKDMP